MDVRLSLFLTHSAGTNPEVIFAHPLTDPGGLLVSPLLLAAVAAVVIAGVALLPSAPARSTRIDAQLGLVVYSWQGSLTRPQEAVRALSVALLVLAAAAGRFGSTDELENIAPALIVGAAWPLLVAVSAAAGPVWRWLDPWDSLARIFVRSDRDEASPGLPSDVRQAAVGALGLVWYLSAYPDTLAPRSIGLALALYTVIALAGCLAVGREAWLGRAEVFGLVFGWLALGPRGLLAAWQPPRGAEAVLGVLAGGLLFGAVRHSLLWGSLNIVPLATLYALAGLVASCSAAAAMLWGAGRWAARRGAPGSVAAASLPAVAALAVSLGMSRNRLFTSIQLLPALAGDPFGAGWDLLGAAGVGLDPNPLGTTGRVAAQVLVLMAGHLFGAYVLTRRSAPAGRVPATVGLCALAAAGMLAVGAV